MPVSSCLPFFTLHVRLESSELAILVAETLLATIIFAWYDELGVFIP